jgi:hypothetical protein
MASPAPDSSAGAEPGAPLSERLPGLDQIYQAKNGSWAPLWLGPGEWAGPTAAAPGAGDASAEPDAASPDETRLSGPASEPPRPAAQDDGDGIL